MASDNDRPYHIKAILAPVTSNQEELPVVLSPPQDGDIKAQYRYGQALLFGESIPVDTGLGLKYIHNAAEGGLGDAQHLLGNLYESGAYVIQDNEEALKWYALASKNQIGVASLAIAVMYSNGKLSPSTPQIQLHWYELAANQGEVQAQYSLACILSQGKLTPRVPGAAFEMLTRSAQGGCEDAQYQLAIWLESGLNCQPDLKRAYFWYRIVEEVGSSWRDVCMDSAEELRSRLSEKEVEVLELDVAKWIDGNVRNR